MSGAMRTAEVIAGIAQRVSCARLSYDVIDAVLAVQNHPRMTLTRKGIDRMDTAC